MLLNRENGKKNFGFSLVELIVVIAIMAVLVGVIAPKFLSYVEKTKVAKDEMLVSNIISSINVAIASPECIDELMTDLDSDSNVYYDVDIAIALSDHANYKNKGYTVWHLKDEDGKRLTVNNSAIISALDSIIDGEQIHFSAKIHENKAYMIKIYKNESGTVVVSPYTDEDYTYKASGSLNEEFYKGGWSSTYYSRPASGQ